MSNPEGSPDKSKDVHTMPLLRQVGLCRASRLPSLRNPLLPKDLDPYREEVSTRRW